MAYTPRKVCASAFIGILRQVRDHVNSVEDVQAAAPTQAAEQLVHSQYYTPHNANTDRSIMRKLGLSKPPARNSPDQT